MPADPPPPPVIPDYELLRLVGRGSYGDVWLARGVTGVFRAVKIVWRDRFADPQPFEREFRGLTEFAAVSLTESRQLALLHVGRHDAAGFFYYVMELADDATRGREIDPSSYTPNSLREVRARRGRLPAAEVVALGTELARGLAGLHNRGLVHRDIKPSNVILVGGQPKLADIGLVASASAALTFVGTEGYVPPEGPGAPAADVFSLGKLLYELATGLDRHDYPRLPPDFNSLADRKELLELNEVLIRACEPIAAKRHHDATALLDDLLLLQAGKSVRRLRAAERRLARALRIAAVLALAAVVAGTGAWVERRRADAETRLRRAAEAERDAVARRSVYAATIGQAQQALEQGDFGRGRELLAATSTAGDLHGFEQAALRHLAAGDPCRVLRTAGPQIDRIVASPDGRLMAVQDRREGVRLYETASFALARHLPDIAGLAGFSSDGRWLLGTDRSLSIQRWRVQDGVAPEPARAAGGFRPLGVQGVDRVIALTVRPPLEVVGWDFAQGRAVLRLPCDDSEGEARWDFYRVGQVNAPGDEVVFASSRGRGNNVEFRVTLARLGAAPALLHQAAPVRPAALGWLDPSGWWLADDASGRRAVFDRRDDRWGRSDIRFPRGTLHQLPLRSEGGTVLAREAVIQIEASGRTTTLRGHATVITALAVSADARHVWSGGTGGDLRVWDLAVSPTLRTQREVWDSNASTSRVFFSPDSRTLFVPEVRPPGSRHRLAVLAADTLEPRTHLDNLLRPAAMHGTTLWTLAADGRAFARWSTDRSDRPLELARAASPIGLVGLSKDGRRLCFTRHDGTLHWLDTTTDAPAPTKIGEKLDNIYPLELNHAGDLMWSATTDRRLLCRALPENRIVWSVPLPARAASVVWLPQRDEIAVAMENGDVGLFAAATGGVRLTAPSGSAAPQSVACAPGESRLILAGNEGYLHVLDTDSGRHLCRLPTGATDALHFVTVAPDESAAAVLTKTGMLHLVRTR